MVITGTGDSRASTAFEAGLATGSLTGYAFWHIAGKQYIMKKHICQGRMQLKPFHLLLAFYMAILGTGLIYNLLNQ